MFSNYHNLSCLLGGVTNMTHMMQFNLINITSLKHTSTLVIHSVTPILLGKVLCSTHPTSDPNLKFPCYCTRNYASRIKTMLRLEAAWVHHPPQTAVFGPVWSDSRLIKNWSETLFVDFRFMLTLKWKLVERFIIIIFHNYWYNVLFMLLTLYQVCIKVKIQRYPKMKFVFSAWRLLPTNSRIHPTLLSGVINTALSRVWWQSFGRFG